MEQKPTIAITCISTLFKILETNGVDTEKFLSQSGLDPSIRKLPESRLTWETVQMLTQRAVQITGDENFGLHQGEAMIGFSNILGHILINCQTVGEAVEKFVKYHKMCDEGSRVSIEMEGKYLLYKYELYNEILSKDRQLSDHYIACSYSVPKHLTGRKFDLIEVRFKHEAPADISEYQRIFNCKIIFESSMNALLCDSKIVNIPISEPNKELLSIFEKYAEEVLSNQEKMTPYSKKVGSLITKMLGDTILQIDMVANKLAISKRKLQLKLQEEGTTYSKILDQIRRDTAIYYLKNKDISIAEISYLLGFSEPSVFHRTFKKWTNHPPGRFRASQIETI